MTTQVTAPEKALLFKKTEPFTALCFTTRATLLTLSHYVYTVADELYAEAARLNMEVSGPIQWIYTGINSDESNEFQLEIALPVNLTGKPASKFPYKVFPPFRCASYTYVGPWSDFGGLYNALFSWLYRAGHQNNGYVREVYSSIDLENPANCATELQIALV